MDGVVEWWLIPGSDALPLSEITKPFFTSFPFAKADSAAVCYPDGHLPNSNGRSNNGSTIESAQVTDEHTRLRRVWPLGWIATYHGDDYWIKTGHVLVINMDRGRDRHPWIILAESWLDHNGEGGDDGDVVEDWDDANDEGDIGRLIIRAKKNAKKGVDGVYGVLPGDDARTPIAKFAHVKHDENDQRPFVKQFGVGFEFELLHPGGIGAGVQTTSFKAYHPDLVRVMGWYWDKDSKEEVCYDESGIEYMR